MNTTQIMTGIDLAVGTKNNTNFISTNPSLHFSSFRPQPIRWGFLFPVLSLLLRLLLFLQLPLVAEEARLLLPFLLPFLLLLHRRRRRLDDCYDGEGGARVRNGRRARS